jgi:uncharacterized circularly permuted ATP-grasp superfamily protein
MEFSAVDMSRRFATADRHIRDTGVSYRAYGDTSERAWPLSHVPLLIEAGEWREIAQGIQQRARLLELVLADIYGEGRLIAAGDLPAAAVTGSPEFSASHAWHQDAGRKIISPAGFCWSKAAI